MFTLSMLLVADLLDKCLEGTLNDMGTSLNNLKEQQMAKTIIRMEIAEKETFRSLFFMCKEKD